MGGGFGAGWRLRLLWPRRCASAAGPVEPRFGADNELIRPEGYREWVFVGSSLGLSYQEGQAPNHEPQFHNIYIQPASYQAFEKTGEFPEGTSW